MFLKNTPLRRKLMAIVLITSGAVLMLTCLALFAYEVVTFRQDSINHLSTLGEMIADNSTASIAFENAGDAHEVLGALKAEPHIVVAALYDRHGALFARYPAGMDLAAFPALPTTQGHTISTTHIQSFHPILQGEKRLGTLYLKSDMGALYDRMRLYAIIVVIIIGLSLVVAFFVSDLLQQKISQPVLKLVETARAVSERGDYSVRATKLGRDEFGLLTDAFNTMLEQIHTRDQALQEAQQSLQEHARELEHRVAHRTAQLSETIAELEAFSYSVSHDMRAPLRAMQGYATLVLDQYGQHLGPEGKGYLERIARAGMKLDKLVQDILTYSRVSQSQLILDVVDLDKLVEDILEQYPNFRSASLLQVVHPLGLALGHEPSLTQVISNLIGNAIKFVRPEEKSTVRIHTEPQGNHLLLHVEDNGIGIAPQDLTRIFSIFVKVHADKTYEGTGIGLSIVRKAVDRMGGTVTVASEVGKGSRFTIRLRAP